jgi:hypothetical protein
MSRPPLKHTRKSPHFPASVLNLPPKSAFTEVPSPSEDYTLCLVEKKKQLLETYRVLIQKTKLFGTLEIY